MFFMIFRPGWDNSQSLKAIAKKVVGVMVTMHYIVAVRRVIKFFLAK